MPQTSVSPLSPIRSMVASDNQGKQCTFKVLSLSTSCNGITAQNMPQTSNSLLSSTKLMVARGNQW